MFIVASPIKVGSLQHFKRHWLMMQWGAVGFWNQQQPNIQWSFSTSNSVQHAAVPDVSDRGTAGREVRFAMD